MFNFLTAAFNLYVGIMLRDSDTKMGRFLCVSNFILAGGNFTLGLVKLVPPFIS